MILYQSHTHTHCALGAALQPGGVERGPFALGQGHTHHGPDQARQVRGLQEHRGLSEGRFSGKEGSSERMWPCCQRLNEQLCTIMLLGHLSALRMIVIDFRCLITISARWAITYIFWGMQVGVQ